MKREEFEARIIQRAWKDPAYRARLKADPRGVVAEELAKVAEGVSLPENVEISVVEETPSRIYLRIPANPAELADAQLDKVVGGQNAAVSTVVTQTLQTIAVSIDVVQAVENLISTSIVGAQET